MFNDLREASIILWDLLAGALVGSNITDVALVIHLSALAIVADDLSFELLTVEAFGILLPSHVSDLLTHETFRVGVSAIIRSPKLVVRRLLAWSVGTLALGLMQA